MTVKERRVVANKLPEGFRVTRHAWERMCGRRLSPDALGMVLTFGRELYAHRIRFFAIGRKEIARERAYGVDLRQLDGWIAVCSPDGGIVTVYRNRNFRGMKPNGHKRQRVRRRLSGRPSRRVGRWASFGGDSRVRSSQ